MDRLNTECLEHIFGYLNCGPKEWLILSKVCVKWKDVILRFWKRINVVEIKRVNGRDRRDRPFLSTKTVTAIMEHAAEHVAEVIITTRKVNSIRLGKHVYCLNGLKMDEFLEVLAKHSDVILKAHFYPDDKFFDMFVSSNPELQKLTLTLDKACVYTFEKDKFPSVDNLELIHKIKGSIDFGKVLESFPEVTKLAVKLNESLSSEKLNCLAERLMSGLQSRPKKLEELYLTMDCDDDYYMLTKMPFHKYNFKSQMDAITNLRVLDTAVIGAEQCLDFIQDFSHLEKLDTQTCLGCLRSKGPEKTISKLKSLTLRCVKYCFFERAIIRPLPEYVETLCKFVDNMPMLQELNIDFDCYRLFSEADFEETMELLRRAVKLGISQKRNVVVNKSIQVVEKRDIFTDEAKSDKAETLAIKIFYENKSIESIRKFLEEAFKNCEITDVEQ